MAIVLPAGYNPPSVFTQTSIEFSQPIIDGNSKIMALIGVSDETKTATAVEVIRGSSATMDNPIYGEDHSNAFLNGVTYTFSVDHFPIVDGTGMGKVTKNPSAVTVYVNGDIANVVSLDGALGAITLQTPPYAGDIVTVDYFFKKKDTFIMGDDVSVEVPTVATVSAFPVSSAMGAPTLSLALTNPGASGNYALVANPNYDPTQPTTPTNSVQIQVGVAVAFRATPLGSSDSVAIVGNGTDLITIDIVKGTDPITSDQIFRTAGELLNLINSFVASKTGGFLKATLTGSSVAATDASLVGGKQFANGTGQDSNVKFQVSNLPIVDGTNGGIPTTDPTKVEAYVNSVKVAISAVDGQHGLVTLASPVGQGQSLKFNYWTNTYRDTSDTLPNADVLSVQQCGYSVRGIDFIPDVNFTLDTDVSGASVINWGSAVKASPLSTTVAAVPFGNNLITPAVVQNEIYLVQAQGVSNGHNITFQLPSLPVSSKGVTDDPDQLLAYVGSTPALAHAQPPVTIASVTGDLGQVTLQVPPTAGQNVYVTYWESRIANETYTLSCVVAGPAGAGTYSVMNSKGKYAPSFVVEKSITGTPFAANFDLLGVVYPHGFSDLMGVPGASPSETITITFIDGNSFRVTSNRTATNVAIDGMGITGGVTTPDPMSPTYGTDIMTMGALGFVGQTFIDSITGVRFTICDARSGADLSAYGYLSGVTDNYAFLAGNQLVITSTLNAALPTGDSAHQTVIPGAKFNVKNTLGVAPGDLGKIQTYANSGDEPNIGDVYYVSYTYAKPASAYDFQVYYSTQEDKVYTAYGYPSATNKLSMAAWLAFRNGAKVVGLLQVVKDPGLNDANDAKYAAALTKLQTLYPGMSRKPQIIVPLNTSPTFLPYLSKHVETQSSIKMRGECVGFFGYANNTNPSTAIATCTSVSSERMVSVYPDGGIITVSDSFGNSLDLVVDGSFVAVAIAALFADPQWDTATPRTHKTITGFKRMFRRLDPNVMNSVAQAGCSLVEQVGSTFRVRHAITTDPSNVLSVQPSITFLKDEVQQDIRDLFDPFIGRKFLNSVLTDMTNDLAALFKSKVDAELIQTYSNISVTRDDIDPRIARVKAAYVPVGELTYIMVDLVIRSRADQ